MAKDKIDDGDNKYWDNLSENIQLVIFNLVYNGGSEILGDNILSAIRNSDLQEAWYEVRYNSNKRSGELELASGIAGHRIEDSDKLGFFSKSTDNKAKEEEYRRAYIMYKNHRGNNEDKSSIIGYENDDRKCKGNDLTIKDLFTKTDSARNASPDNAFSYEIEPARGYLVNKYGLGKDIAWDAVIVGKDTDKMYKNDTGTGYSLGGTDKGKDTISLAEIGRYEGTTKVAFKTGETTLTLGGSGDDTITGAGSNDIIYSEDGDDIIKGGKGNDIIFSGNGYDTIDGGEGNDIIDFTVHSEKDLNGQDYIPSYIKTIKFGSNIMTVDLGDMSASNICLIDNRLILSGESASSKDSILNLDYRSLFYMNCTIKYKDGTVNANDFHDSGYILLEDYIKSLNPDPEDNGNIMGGFGNNFYTTNESIRE